MHNSRILRSFAAAAAQDDVANEHRDEAPFVGFALGYLFAMADAGLYCDCAPRRGRYREELAPGFGILIRFDQRATAGEERRRLRPHR